MHSLVCVFPLLSLVQWSDGRINQVYALLRSRQGHTIPAVNTVFVMDRRDALLDRFSDACPLEDLKPLNHPGPGYMSVQVWV